MVQEAAARKLDFLGNGHVPDFELELTLTDRDIDYLDQFAVTGDQDFGDCILNMPLNRAAQRASSCCGLYSRLLQQPLAGRWIDIDAQAAPGQRLVHV